MADATALHVRHAGDGRIARRAPGEECGLSFAASQLRERSVTIATHPLSSKELLMQLTALLNQARSARPDRRIELRDPIASFGRRAIDEMCGWIDDPRLGAFAVRVVVRAGQHGERPAALRALRAARQRTDVDHHSDLDWAMASLQPPKSTATRTRRQTVVQSPRAAVSAHRYAAPAR